jgi:hypothetical protein
MPLWLIEHMSHGRVGTCAMQSITDFYAPISAVTDPAEPEPFRLSESEGEQFRHTKDKLKAGLVRPDEAGP